VFFFARTPVPDDEKSTKGKVGYFWEFGLEQIDNWLLGNFFFLNESRG